MATAVLETALTILYDPRDEDEKAGALELLNTLGNIIDHTPYQKMFVKVENPEPN